MFRLDRIKSLELTDGSFEQPVEGATELPPPLFYVPGPDDMAVRLRVPMHIAQWLAEYGGIFPPLPVQSSRDVSGGKRELSFRTSAFAWLEKLLLRFGDEIEVLEPTELGDRMRDAARRILALYEKPKKR
jgi:predicted DNA-binding transcriptional regulator YafY